MDQKTHLVSPEVATGLLLLSAGLAAQVVGVHSQFSNVLVPFGVGLILSDLIVRAGRMTRERVKVRVGRREIRQNRR